MDAEQSALLLLAHKQKFSYPNIGVHASLHMLLGMRAASIIKYYICWRNSVTWLGQNAYCIVVRIFFVTVNNIIIALHFHVFKVYWFR
jgi:hypothetical protein